MYGLDRKLLFKASRAELVMTDVYQVLFICNIGFKFTKNRNLGVLNFGGSYLGEPCIKPLSVLSLDNQLTTV